ncbi:MAG: hypothetical protein M3Q27_00700 [Actinomycetota bacterium]|nr:hypothetical protein [Actinomycetota bacterium]
MEIGYALEKVGVGMSILARHPGRIRERLLAAFTEQILFAPTEGKGIPDEVGRRLQAVKDQASRIPGVGNEGALAATFAVIDENEAEEIVGELEWIYYSLQSAREHPEEYGALGHARPELSRHRVASSR